MRSGTYRDPASIEHGGDIMRMGAVHVEGYDGALAFRVAEDPQRVDPRQSLMRIIAQAQFMRMNALAADPSHIVHGGAEPDRLHDRRCAGFETMRRLVIGHAILGDFIDHLAAAEEGRQFLQPFLLAVERADAGRPIELMAGEAIKIDIELNNLDVGMDRALRTIDQYGYPALMRDPDYLLDRRYRA